MSMQFLPDLRCIEEQEEASESVNDDKKCKVILYTRKCLIKRFDI